jgi:hypothetical protein
MKSVLIVSALLLSAAWPSQGFARDFGYEKFADAVQAVYGDGYGIMANIGQHIKLNLNLHSLAVRGGSDANPLLVFSEGPKIFAIRAEPLPLK